jgi:hypothetical protein
LGQASLSKTVCLLPQTQARAVHLRTPRASPRPCGFDRGCH